MSRVGSTRNRKQLVIAMLGGIASQALPLASVPLFAQEQVQRGGLEEVIVTSRRTEEALQDVPLSITALGEEALARSNMQNFADMQQKVPSVSLVPSTGRRTSQIFSIRGQRTTESVTTVDTPVGLYIAEVPVARSAGVAISGFLDVGSIEVLKGPQGTLFGRNTTGGAIVVSPNTPENEFKGSAGVGFGNYDRQKYNLMLNTPITDNAAARIALERGTRDGVIENRSGFNDAYGDDYYAGRGSFRWQPTDALVTTFFGDYLKADDDGGAVVVRAVNPGITTPPTLDAAYARQQAADFFSFESSSKGFGHNEVWGVSNTTTYDISDSLMIKNVIGYRRGDSDDQNDIDGAEELVLGGRRVYTGHQFSEEIQLQGDFDRLTWSTGLFYFQEVGEDFTYTFNRNVRPSDLNRGVKQGGEATNTSYSFFGQGTYALTDALNLTVGARMTWDKRELDATSVDITNGISTCQLFAVDVGTATAPGCEFNMSKTFHSPTWNVSLDYKLDATQLVYAATRRGYRTGGFSPRPTRPIQTQSYDPETVTDIEVGYKGDLDIAGQPLRVNVATYYSDYEDIQRTVPYYDAQTGRPFSLTRNAATGTIWGGELEVTWVPLDSLEVSMFYGRIHARIDDAEVDNATGTAKVDISKNRFATTPEHKAGLTVRYQLPVSSDIGELYLQASGTVQSETWTDNGNRFDGTNIEIPGSHQSGYALYDARIDWEQIFGAPLRVSLWGKNLSNTEYVSAGNVQYTTLGFSQAAPGEPRTYGVDVKYDF